MVIHHLSMYGGNGDITHLICCVTSHELQHHVTLQLLIVYHHNAKFGGHRHCRSGDKMFDM